MNIEKIMVVGAGQMGSGIAQVCATSGFEVVLYDIQEEAVSKGLANIYNLLSRQVGKGKLSEGERKEIINRIQQSTSLQDARDCQFVIEAAVENIDVKKDIFKQLDEMTRPETILATNTSSLPITEIAAVTNRPEKVIGMHFMNPVPVMKLIEVIRGLATSDETYEIVNKLGEKLNKVPIEVNDFPGFIANRILLPMINEAIYALYEGVATKEAIDDIMKLGMNHPMGPLQLADFIGLDTCLYIMETLHEGLGDDKYRPCPLLRKYVNAGWLGKKTGRGFYVYQ
ncbi:3-hydroxybutyryl-CoA dehydrogenase [Caldibacillus thermolactis]|jgi:3-hydroxybutyryl-CoA dehydrogenase|uniref:3-hydroxybutyryl-CoA dehydrogenase n=1 Tax=Pallidibacillus thermolactis TaxID=251051 RepID=A0ABT2WIL9_9BACI|nr:3-hydroxybutyryl-CoA dehydrogenase [Pallidibacillus thermolactis]MCU9593897.1 3-hydroxybutyryl-CoA dehydrogenase [Pallidibacillus thermolactis]MCU9600216.1 3-hydroxybutyryl-CoA dehydrogenase [Pallidibacillus thermolactis subsp. kokeshiiformis]MED1673424.1 3-hydroxybutyryl-CoA dehydrogenase [Pallidibacillus thermolactis subsp. kokeshiiformis]